MHYNEHLGKQAVSFLRNLMKQYGNDKFEEQFFEMLKSYPSLNGLLLSDIKSFDIAIKAVKGDNNNE